MTKTLTEQWRDGTLDGGIYYLLLKDGTTVTDKTIYIVGEKQLRWSFSSFDFVKEVLAPVPRYDEFVQQRDFVKDHQNLLIENMNLKQQIERLQEQLKEANDVIKGYSKLESLMNSVLGPMENCPSQKYIEKWDVK